MTVEQVIADNISSMVKWIGIFWGGASALCFIVSFLIKDTEKVKNRLKKVRIDGQ